MTLFVDKQKITGKETEQLFSAGISLLLSKAYPAAYSCFNRISDEDFSVLYNKALCCFMVNKHLQVRVISSIFAKNLILGT